MHHPIQLYPVSFRDHLPSWRLCLLSLLTGVALMWLHDHSLLVPVLLTLLALSLPSALVILKCIRVGGKAG